MKIELTREDLIAMIKGSSVPFTNEAYSNSLVKKAGHSYSDQYGQTYWSDLNKLTDDELWELRKVCR